MVRSLQVLCFTASLLAAARVCAEEINFAAAEENFFGLDEFDKGPSSGPFSNKPGWPKLDGPGEDDSDDNVTAAPAPTLTLSAVTATAPAPATSAPTTQAPATSAPTTQAPATIAPTTTTPTTSAPLSTTKAPAGAAASATPSMTPAQPKGSGATSAPTTLKPATASTGTQTPQSAQGSAGDHARCSKDSTLVSVEGIAGSHCVSTAAPFCSAEHPSGNCPGPQSGLEQGSRCGRVKSGVYGCLPGARGAERINCHVDG